MKYIAIFIILSIKLMAYSPTNLEVITASLDSVVSKSLPFAINKTITIKSDNELFTQLLENAILKNDSTIKITESDESTSTIRIDSLSIKYIEETNERIIFVKTVLVYFADDHIVDFPYSQTYTDTINLNNINSLEDESFPVTKGILVKSETSFWEDAIEPAVYVTAAAAVIYLLFSIRSK